MKTVALLLLFISFAFSFECISDSDCNSKGTCQKDGSCYCQSFYEGDDCSLHWADKHTGWLPIWIIYCVWTCILNLVIITRIMYVFIKYKGYKVNMVNVVTTLLLLASLSKRLKKIPF